MVARVKTREERGWGPEYVPRPEVLSRKEEYVGAPKLVDHRFSAGCDEFVGAWQGYYRCRSKGFERLGRARSGENNAEQYARLTGKGQYVSVRRAAMRSIYHQTGHGKVAFPVRASGANVKFCRVRSVLLFRAAWVPEHCQITKHTLAYRTRMGVYPQTCSTVSSNTQDPTCIHAWAENGMTATPICSLASILCRRSTDAMVKESRRQASLAV